MRPEHGEFVDRGNWKALFRKQKKKEAPSRQSKVLSEIPSVGRGRKRRERQPDLKAKEEKRGNAVDRLPAAGEKGGSEPEEGRRSKEEDGARKKKRNRTGIQ